MGEPQSSPTLEKEPDSEKVLGSEKSFVQIAHQFLELKS